MSLSSTRPAENPSTGFLFSSERKKNKHTNPMKIFVTQNKHVCYNLNISHFSSFSLSINGVYLFSVPLNQRNNPVWPYYVAFYFKKIESVKSHAQKYCCVASTNGHINFWMRSIQPDILEEICNLSILKINKKILRNEIGWAHFVLQM